MRIGRGAAGAVIAAVCLATPAGAAQSALSSVRLSGYTVTTAAVPMSLGEVSSPSGAAAMANEGTHIAYTEAATETGSRSRALASPVWAALPKSDAGRAVNVPGAESLVAVRASYPGGPDRAGTRVPGGPAVSATANGESAVASAAASLASINGFAVAEELAGLSQSAKDDTGAVGRGLATVGKVQVLGGLILIEGVVTRVKVVSDGAKAIVEGNTTVNKVVVAGTPVTLTASSGNGLPEPSERLLRRLGITLRLIEPDDAIDGPGGSRSVGGVLLRYDSKLARTFFENREIDDRASDPLPDRWHQWNSALMAMGGDVTLRFGQVAVHAAATPAAATVKGAGGAEGRALGAVTDAPAAADVEAGEFVTIEGEESAIASAPRFLEVVGGVGIPVLLVVLALFTALALALPLARVAEDAIASGDR